MSDLDNYLGDNYEKLTKNKTERLYKQYQVLEQQAQRGNITALCIKVDLDMAMDAVLSDEEYICTELYLIEGKRYITVAKETNLSYGTVRNRVKNSISKLNHYLQFGGDEYN